MKNVKNILFGLVETYRGKIPKGARRSSDWVDLSKQIKAEIGKCEICGTKEKLVVHHKVPFHIAPELEMNRENLIVLCESDRYGKNCHLLFGHLGNWRRYNSAIGEDKLIWSERLKGKVK